MLFVIHNCGEKEKKTTQELSKFHSELKKDGTSYYHAVESHLKYNGKKGAYHGGKWNGKAMKDPTSIM